MSRPSLDGFLRQQRQTIFVPLSCDHGHYEGSKEHACDAGASQFGGCICVAEASISHDMEVIVWEEECYVGYL